MRARGPKRASPPGLLKRHQNANTQEAMMATTTDKLAAVNQERLQIGLDRLLRLERPRLRRLWAYFKNPMRVCGAADGGPAGSEKPYRQAQEWGLPPRITGVRSGSEPFCDGVARRRETARKEVVIENDIGWRIDTKVDYIYVKPLEVASEVADTLRLVV